MTGSKTQLPGGLPRRLRWAGYAVLGLGLIAALCIYFQTFNANETGASSYSIQGGQVFSGDDSREMRELERMGGKASVMTFRFEQWLSSLWHGIRLAGTLTVLSLVTAGLLFYFAGLMEEAIDT